MKGLTCLLLSIVLAFLFNGCAGKELPREEMESLIKGCPSIVSVYLTERSKANEVTMTVYTKPPSRDVHILHDDSVKIFKCIITHSELATTHFIHGKKVVEVGIYYMDVPTHTQLFYSLSSLKIKEWSEVLTMSDNSLQSLQMTISSEWRERSGGEYYGVGYYGGGYYGSTRTIIIRRR